MLTCQAQPAFFTVDLAERKGNRLLVNHIDALRCAFRYVRERHPVRLDAAVVLPDHLHCVWTLPTGDTDFSMLWNLLKGHFSRPIEKGERVSRSREKRRERGLWQRGFWEHLLRDQNDVNQHVDYIQLESGKAWLGKADCHWPYTSLHDYSARGIYPANSGRDGKFDVCARE